MSKKEKPTPLFIDDVSKKIFYTSELEAAEPSLLFDKAYWVPALGILPFDGHIYVSGATGSGKSYLIRKIINNDKKKRQCVLFTDLKNNDPAFEGMNYVKYKETLADYDNDEVDAVWLKANSENKIFIFDDVQYNKAVILYRNFMLEKARHIGSIVICVNHKLRDYHATKVPLNESRYVIAFPCANKGSIKSYLKNELEIPKDYLEFILNNSCKEGRHLIVHKFAPNCIASTHSIYKL